MPPKRKTPAQTFVRPTPALRVSARGRAALKAVFEIAYGDGTPVHVGAIAQRAGLQEAFVAQVAHALRRAGLIAGKRGPRGGFTLAREPGGITVGEVLRAAEGTPLITELGGDPAPGRAVALWTELDDRLAAVLEGVTVADLVRRAEELAVPRAPGRAQREPILYFI